MRAVALPRGWAFDTDTKLTLASAKAILTAPFPTGGLPRTAIGRYLSLENPSAGDLTIAERDDILAAGWPAIFLIQHVPWASWIANNRIGSLHGASAARQAKALGAAPGTHIAIDMEGLGNNGAAAYDYIAYASDSIRAPGFEFVPRVYDGYDDGLPDQFKLLLYTRGIIAALDWWADFGPRQVPPPLRIAMKQHVTLKLGGTDVDPNEVLIDNVVMAMALDLVS